MAHTIMDNRKFGELFSSLISFKLILVGILIFSVGTFFADSEISALAPPKKFAATLGPDQQVLGNTNPFEWKQSTAHGTATFTVNREMTEIQYTIHLNNIENVVGISIQRGAVGENGDTGSELVVIKATDTSNPEHFANGGTKTGVIQDGDVCPATNPHGVDCTVYGLVYEIVNHRAYLQVKTNNDVGIENSGPNDLVDPGEIRGQIYTIPTSTIFEAQINAQQQVLDDVTNHMLWDAVTSSGHAKFILNNDMTKLDYTITLQNIQNVAKIQILNDVARKNSDFSLVNIGTYNSASPFPTSGKITGTITNSNICPAGNQNGNSIFGHCTIEGLVHEVVNHRAYIQVKTDDATFPQDSAAGDLFNPGEIRGQIVPSAKCNDCVINPQNQILTIFKFETADMPFLADTVTFQITPNPYAHNVGIDHIDPHTFGTNLIITDNDELDDDPTKGVIELIGVNPGVYSVLELKGPPGFMKTDDVYSSAEIYGEAYPHVHVTNLKIEFDTLTDPVEFEPPEVHEEILNKLEQYVAKIGNVEITSSDQLPTSRVTLVENVYDEPPPQKVEFETQVEKLWTVEQIFENLGIPTYPAPSLTSGAEEETAFVPPLFVAQNDEGQDIVMSPIIEEVVPGTDIVMRLDDATNVQTQGKSVSGVTLPLDTFGENVGVSVEVLEEIPTNLPEFQDVSIETSLFLDFDFVGNVDFSNEDTFSEPPTIDFSLPVDASGLCPGDVEVYLLNEDTQQWELVTPPPTRNSTIDVLNVSCGYTQPVVHFSSYMVGFNPNVVSNEIPTSGGGGDDGHDHSSHDHGEHDHSSHDHGDGVVDDSSSDFDDNDIASFDFNEDGIIDQDEFDAFVESEGFIDEDTFEFGEESDIEFDVHEFDLSFTIVDFDSFDFENLDFEFDEFDEFNDFEEFQEEDVTNMLVDINDQKYPISYDVEGGEGEIRHVKINDEEKSVAFDLENVKAGELIIRIPRNVVDAQEDAFVVLMIASPEREVPYEIVKSSDAFVTLKLFVPDTAKKITVKGDSIIPLSFGATMSKDGFTFGRPAYPVSFTIFDSALLASEYDFGDSFEGTNMLVDVDDRKFPVKFALDGQITGFRIHEKSNSILLDLENVIEGEFTVRLLRSMLDADDDKFFTMVTTTWDSDTTYRILESTDEHVTLAIDLPNDAKTLTIIGTKVVPEYGIFATLVLLVGISAVIILNKKQGGLHCLR